MKHFIILLFFSLLLLTSCKKEYEVDFEQIEMHHNQFVRIEHESKIFKAKNDEDAAKEAFSYYMSRIRTAYHMKDDSYYWIPIDYTLQDKKGNRIPALSKEDKLEQYNYVPEETIEWYKDMLGYKFIGTPYFDIYQVKSY